MPVLKRVIACLALAFTLASCETENARGIEFPQLAAPAGQVVLEVRGALSHTNSDQVARFDMDMLRALPSVSVRTTTSVTDGVHHFEGFLLRDFLRMLGAKGSTVIATAHNNYVVEIPFSDFERFDAIIAYQIDGEPLAANDKGPLWIVYPRDDRPELQDIRYDYRWVWQLEALEIR
jgi:hypothetical protein